MFERIGAFEPWIEHPVGIHEIGDTCVLKGAPGGQGVILPEALNDHNIVLMGQSSNAGRQIAAVAIATSHRAQADRLERLIPQPGIIWSV